tara:strand:+ start:3934 stop:5943 length:2010 start_codon:yes stop_codon:yes gene_type:complete
MTIAKPIRKILFLFIFFSFLFHSFSQTSVLDSLKNNLELYPKADSIRTQLLYDYANSMRSYNPNSSVKDYLNCITVADKSNTQSLHAKALQGLGIAYGMQSNYVLSIEYFSKALELGKKIKNAECIGDAYNGLGIVYKRLGDYPQSLIYYSESLKFYDSINSQKGIAASMCNMGVLYDLMHEPERSMEYYQRALQIQNKLNEPSLKIPTKANIAILYLDQERYEEALKIFIENWRSYDSLGNIPKAISPKVNAGFTLIKLKKYNEGEAILLEAFETAKEFQMLQEQADIINNLYLSALETGKNDRALQLAKQYSTIAEGLGSKKFTTNSYEILAEIYEKIGKYPDALSSYKLYKAWNDSLFNEDKERAFNAQEIKVEILEKNKQLAEQDLRMDYLQERVVQEERLKWMLVIISILLLVLGILFYQKFSERRKVNTVLSIKNNEISLQKTHIEEMNFQLENRLLRAQINPHFIFNSLSSIQHFITSGDKPSTLKYLSKFSHLLRKVLESSISGNVVMSEELKLLKMYLDLEALRFDNSFSYTINVDPNLDIETIEIPTMIIQPLVENAILHGLIPKSSNRKLSISFRKDEENMEIEIEDNGIGREAAEKLQNKIIRNSPSRGLSVTQMRLDSLKTKHGRDSKIFYTDLVENGISRGTRVSITLQILENSI